VITPLTSKLMPWHIARAVQAAFAPTISVLTFWGVFFNTWADVYRPSGAQRNGIRQ
jgi:hypothetical protein